MKFSKIVGAIKYYWQFMPFKINFILFITLLFFGSRWLKSLKTDTSSYIGLVVLMSKIIVLFAIMLLIISFLSTFICWLYFLIKKDGHSQQDAIILNLQKETNTNGVLKINTTLPFAIKPILGFVKIKLLYDKNSMTKKYSIANRIKKQFINISPGLTSMNELELPDIKEYHFSKAIIYFEDMLQFFSFAFSLPIHQSISNNPYNISVSKQEVVPKKTNEEKIRIEQLRRVEGEYLNYKKFEDSDDVRRIVWKIFAKNKELVVRIPEIMDPFASTIYMYASFFNETNYQLLPHFQQEMLNRFKLCVWTIYDEFSKNEFALKFIFDQSVNNIENNTVQNNITFANWQNDKALVDYFKPSIGSILCIHSFNSISDLQKIITSLDNQTTVFFVQLSKSFKSNYLLNWILRIFIKPSSDNLTQLKNKWSIHPFRFHTQQHEKKIIELLKKDGVNFEII